MVLKNIKNVLLIILFLRIGQNNLEFHNARIFRTKKSIIENAQFLFWFKPQKSGHEHTLQFGE